MSIAFNTEKLYQIVRGHYFYLLNARVLCNLIKNYI